MVVCCLATFMVSLDQLVVTTALPQIRVHLHTGIQGLEWTVNAYTLTFAVFLITASSLADRFGRRLFFLIGMVLFTGASALAAAAPDVGVLIVARAIQGLGAAVVLPLTLTLLSGAFPPSQRGAALGAWGGIGGLAVALGPVVGGLLVEWASWQWIFWLNVPIGAVLLVLSRAWLTDSRGGYDRIDVVGTVAASVGLFGVVLAIVRGNSAGWTGAEVLGSGLAGLVVISGFLWWQRVAPAPMLPLDLFRSRAFSMVNLLSLFMFFGMFGSIFLITQFLQTAQGYSPLEAGVRFLAWTGIVLIAAPAAGVLSDRIGGKPIIVAGLVLQAAGLLALAATVSATSSFLSLVPPFLLCGCGMGLYYGPTGNVVMSSVRREEEGIASGANNAIRELGGVLGIAVLAALFSARGGYDSPAHYVRGLTYALWFGSGGVALAVVASMILPGHRPSPAAAPPDLLPAEAAATDTVVSGPPLAFPAES